MHIKETILVEGKHDQAHLEKVIDATILVSQGSHLSASLMRQLTESYHNEGLIIFTDPDTPGQKLRQRLSQTFPLAKHAYLPQNQARTSKKIGIEHADLDLIQEALKHLVSPSEALSDLSMNDLFRSEERRVGK